MAELITIINYCLHILLWPFSMMPRWFGLLAVSILSGIVLMWAYGKVSNQTKLKKVKSKIYSHLLESILFKNDLRQSLFAQLKMFLAGIRYFSLAIIPVLVLGIPCLFLLAEINIQYGYQSLKANSPAIIQLDLVEADTLYNVKLDSSDLVEVSPPVRDPQKNQVFWRVNSKSAGAQALDFTINGSQKISKTLFVDNVQGYMDAVWKSSWIEKVLYPAAPSKIDNVKSLSISYPEQLYSLGFTDVSWLVFFLIFSMLTGIVASKILGVEI